MSNRTILFFNGPWATFSNFAETPIEVNGRTWATGEHLFQAVKARNRRDQERIRNAPSAKEAKRIGRTILLRPGWDEIRVPVMRQVVRLKIEQSEEVRKALSASQDYRLVEGNYHHDNFWGDCQCSRCMATSGKNWLGRIWEQERERWLSELLKSFGL